MRDLVSRLLRQQQRSFCVLSRRPKMTNDDRTSHISNPIQVIAEDSSGPGQQPLNSNEEKFEVIREGLASLNIPLEIARNSGSKTRASRNVNSRSVFYNPIQQFNRDLSVLAIRAFGEDFLAARNYNLRGKYHQSHITQSNWQNTQKRKKKHIRINDSDDHDEYENSVKRAKYRGDPTNKHKNLSNDTEFSEEHDCVESPKCHAKPYVGASVSNEQLTQQGMRYADATASNESKRACGLRILDALSATGLRALRYATEIPFISSITANDISAEATNIIRRNVASNCLDHLINVVTGDAVTHMYATSSKSSKAHIEDEKYDVIDLDPYGTAVPFLDAALQALSDGGLLCVTCTDAAVWASCGYPEKTYSLYGGMPIKGLHSHEGGLRLILHAIATAAARHGMSIEPLLSLYIDFYARVFVRVFKSPIEVKLLAGKTMLVYNCDSGCGAWSLQFLARNQLLQSKTGTSYHKHSLAQGPSSAASCKHCGSKTHISGPMYGGKLHNTQFLKTILNYLPEIEESTYNTRARIEGVISTAIEETLGKRSQDMRLRNIDSNATPETRRIPRIDPAEIDFYPFFFIPSALSKVLHCSAPSEAAFRGALMHAGYEVTRSHIRPNSIRTNAPWSFIWNVMREWVKQKAPIKEEKLKRGTAGWNILHGPSHTNTRENPCLREQAEKQPDSNDSRFPISGMSSIDSSSFAQTIVFDENLGRELKSKRLVRYQLNPRPNWGPINRAKGY